MDFILPDEKQMEKMAEEYAKIKLLRPQRASVVQMLSAPNSEKANPQTEQPAAGYDYTKTLLLIFALSKCGFIDLKSTSALDTSTDKSVAKSPSFSDKYGQICHDFKF